MKFRILLVEDDECVGPVVLEILFRSGYDATLAIGLAAVKKLKHFNFAAIITDFRLRDGDACDVIDFMRSNIPDLPAIVISGLGSQVATDCADRRITNVVFVDKPFRSQQLLDSLKACTPAKTKRLVIAQNA